MTLPPTFTEETKREFAAGIPPRGLHPSAGDFNQNGESEVRRFGYKILRGDEIFTVVDWGNIESFLLSRTQDAYNLGRAETLKEVREMCEGMKIDMTDGSNQLVAIIKDDEYSPKVWNQCLGNLLTRLTQ